MWWWWKGTLPLHKEDSEPKVKDQVRRDGFGILEWLKITNRYQATVCNSILWLALLIFLKGKNENDLIEIVQKNRLPHVIYSLFIFSSTQQILMEVLLCVRNSVAVTTIFVYLCYTFILVQGYCVYQILMVVILYSNDCRCLSHASCYLIEHQW